MLPFNLKINDELIISKANAEIVAINDKVITFRPIQNNTEIYIIKNGAEILLEYEGLKDISINLEAINEN